MAGDDPGASTLSAILEASQRLWAAATGALKAVVGGIVDVLKLGIMIRWRKQLMNAQNPVSHVRHGKQSLRHLREHEALGTRIVTVAIGDKTAMKTLDAELGQLKIDYSITRSGKEYLLHYKEGNEEDVLLAQKRAMAIRFGTPDTSTPETDLHDRGDMDRRRSIGHEDERPDRRPNDPYLPTPATDIRMAKANPASSDVPRAQRASDAMRVEAPRPVRSQKPAPSPAVSFAAAPANQDKAAMPGISGVIQPERTSHEDRMERSTLTPTRASSQMPLDKVIEQAKSRSSEKNLARKRNHARDMKVNRSRTMGRKRSRDMLMSR